MEKHQDGTHRELKDHSEGSTEWKDPKFERPSDDQNAIEVVRRNLSGFALYDESHHVHAFKSGNQLCIGYSVNALVHRDHMHFDIGIVGSTCHGIAVRLCDPHRGHGHGTELYNRIEAIARELGCTRMQTARIGTSVTGESPSEWFREQGYTPCSDVAWEKVLTE